MNDFYISNNTVHDSSSGNVRGWYKNGQSIPADIDDESDQKPANPQLAVAASTEAEKSIWETVKFMLFGGPVDGSLACNKGVDEVDEACQENLPDVGALNFDHSTLNAEGNIVYDSEVTLLLPIDTRCYDDAENMTVNLSVGAQVELMTAAENGPYTATLTADWWNPPIKAEVVDRNGRVLLTRQMWSLPPVVPPEEGDPWCETNPEPMVSTTTGATPDTDYDIESGLPVCWKIWAENCDETYENIVADCDFGPLGIISEVSDALGVISICTPLTEKITSGIYCDVIGSNDAVNSNATVLWPPFYATIDPELTPCEEASGYPTVGSLMINPSSYNVLGQLVYGESATFDLLNTFECDETVDALDATLYAGYSIVPMTYASGMFSADVPIDYWGTPVYVEVQDIDRGTSGSSYMWSLPPIVAPTLTGCAADPKPHAYTVAGPTPALDYDITSGTPVQWQIWTDNCDYTTNGLYAECDFGPFGAQTFYGDDLTGIITVNQPLDQKLTGYFPCDITGSNAETLTNGALLYPPYYLTP